jgi:hypothetical protein
VDGREASAGDESGTLGGMRWFRMADKTADSAPADG